MFSSRGGFLSGTEPAVILIKTNNPGTSTSTQFTLPFVGAPVGTTIIFYVNWGDNTGDEQITSTSTIDSRTHTYSVAGTYQIKIYGDFRGFRFNNTGDKLKLLEIQAWGNILWRDMNNAFYGCSNLIGTYTDYPNVSQVPQMINTFRDCTNFNSSLVNWDVSYVTSMMNTFTQATKFNQPLNSWNISNVTSIRGMFELASAFNQDLNSWNTANINDMQGVFNSATAFNGNIISWNTANVTNMVQMFTATAFNQNIGGWNVSNVANMLSMFTSASLFNGNINNWNVSNVTDMSFMFSTASTFNQNISSWNVAKVTNMASMFNSATAFNQNIGTWNIGNVTNMNAMFNSATAFNQNLGNWHIRTAGVTMSSMLNNCGMNTDNYNRTIIGWANWVSGHANTPGSVTLGANGRTYSNVLYTGTPYNRANTARTYLDTGTPAWTFVGDSQV